MAGIPTVDVLGAGFLATVVSTLRRAFEWFFTISKNLYAKIIVAIYTTRIGWIIVFGSITGATLALLPTIFTHINSWASSLIYESLPSIPNDSVRLLLSIIFDSRIVTLAIDYFLFLIECFVAYCVLLRTQITFNLTLRIMGAVMRAYARL